MTAAKHPLATYAAAAAHELVDGEQTVTRLEHPLAWCELLVALRDLQRGYFDGLADAPALAARLAHVASELRGLAADHVLAFVERELALLEHPIAATAERTAWRTEPLASTVPTMSTPDVLRYYRWLARTAPLAGALLDLGCWYGASSFALADGVAARRDAVRPPVLAVDTFRCEPWMAAYATDLGVGDSFLARFRAYCAPFGDLVIPVTCDVTCDGAWARTVRGPIGILVYDLDRSRATLENVLAAVTAHVVRGETVLVLATYGHLASQSIREWATDHRDRLQPLHAPWGPVRSFRVMGALA